MKKQGRGGSGGRKLTLVCRAISPATFASRVVSASVAADAAINVEGCGGEAEQKKGRLAPR